MIYVGTCGYAYKDWTGTFYPPRMRAAEMLPYHARQFPVVEIDSSYYGVPRTSSVLSMERRTPAGFRFSFKAPQSVTHPPEATARVHGDAALLCAALAPLRESGKLACVLAQFPNGFRPSSQTEQYLRRVVGAFEEIAVVVEFRHRDWQQPSTLELLRDVGASLANVDMPAFSELPAASSDVTGAIGYVRLHGRNAKQWWTGSNVTRYQYLYAPGELVPWTDRVAEIAARTDATYVLFNNHARGNAPRNAEMFEALLDERYGNASAEFIAHAPGGNVEQDRLPGFELPAQEHE